MVVERRGCSLPIFAARWMVSRQAHAPLIEKCDIETRTKTHGDGSLADEPKGTLRVGDDEPQAGEGVPRGLAALEELLKSPRRRRQVGAGMLFTSFGVFVALYPVAGGIGATIAEAIAHGAQNPEPISLEVTSFPKPDQPAHRSAAVAPSVLACTAGG